MNDTDIINLINERVTVLSDRIDIVSTTISILLDRIKDLEDQNHAKHMASRQMP